MTLELSAHKLCAQSRFCDECDERIGDGKYHTKIALETVCVSYDLCEACYNNLIEEDEEEAGTFDEVGLGLGSLVGHCAFAGDDGRINPRKQRIRQ